MKETLQDVFDWYSRLHISEDYFAGGQVETWLLDYDGFEKAVKHILGEFVKDVSNVVTENTERKEQLENIIS